MINVVPNLFFKVLIMIRILLSFLLCLALGACSTMTPKTNPRQIADQIAMSGGLQPFTYRTSTISIASYSKINAAMGPITIYIEGSESDDFVALRLAVQDPVLNIVYLNNPCRLIDKGAESGCNDRSQFNDLFSVENIQSYGEILDKIKAEQQSLGFHLVGYSNGGTIATMLAAQRSDILSLRTLAGLKEADRLADASESLSLIPQIHYVGSKDHQVTPSLAENFIQNLSDQSCAEIQIAPDVTHDKGWDQFWPQHVGFLPACSYLKTDSLPSAPVRSLAALL
jgi:predicted esterase